MVECSIYLLFSFVLLFFDVVQDEMLLMVMVHKANRIDGQSVRFTFNLLSKDQHAESASTEWGQRVSKCAKGIEATLPFFPSFIAYRATDEIRSIHRSNHRSNDRSINRSINRWVFFPLQNNIYGKSTNNPQSTTDLMENDIAAAQPKMEAKQPIDRLIIIEIHCACDKYYIAVGLMSYISCTRYLCISYCLLSFCPHTYKHAHA